MILKTGFVYCLADRSGNPFYVGATDCVEKRLIGHKAAAKKSNLAVYRYIRENKIEFELKVLQKVKYVERFTLFDAERRWIRKFKKQGFCLKNTDKHTIGPAVTKVIPIDARLLTKVKIHCADKGFFLGSFIALALKEKMKSGV